jgi:hypothetical protein
MSDERTQDFLVNRSDFREFRWDELTDSKRALEPGEVRLQVDRYAFTANNITYAVFGDALHYWDFFPAPAGWGRLPVWGHADVVESRATALAEGARVFGYLPMSPELLVRPADVSERGFRDASEHRSALPGTYQQYQITRRGNDEQEALRALLAPLFGTAFLIDDWLDEHARFGAKRVLLMSASSKTALGTAFMLSQRTDRAYEIVGLTSARNRAFCESLGYYDRVLEYGAVRELDASTPTVSIDMAGDASVLQAVHEHLGAALCHSCLVGATHRVPPSAESTLPGPTPEFFFAPAQIQKRLSTWGPDGLGARISAAQQAFFPSAKTWLAIVPVRGKAAIESAYRTVLDGKANPNEGLMLSASK